MQSQGDSKVEGLQGVFGSESKLGEEKRWRWSGVFFFFFTSATLYHIVPIISFGEDGQTERRMDEWMDAWMPFSLFSSLQHMFLQPPSYALSLALWIPRLIAPASLCVFVCVRVSIASGPIHEDTAPHTTTLFVVVFLNPQHNPNQVFRRKHVIYTRTSPFYSAENEKEKKKSNKTSHISLISGQGEGYNRKKIYT